MFFQIGNNDIVYLKRKTTACSKFRKEHSMIVRQSNLPFQFFQDTVLIRYPIQELILYFGYDSQQRNFIKGYFIQIVGYLHVQMAVFVQIDLNFLRIEAERRKPLPIHTRQKTAMAAHVFQFFLCQRHQLQVLNFISQSIQKAFRIFGFIAVFKRKRSYRIRKQFDISIRSGKLI